VSEAGPGVAAGFVSGFVSILGRPNAGKSTLLNALVGTKVAIVADKPQTTRVAIQGVLHRPEGQIIFLDTPGIHPAGTLLDQRMMRAVRDALSERDLLLYVVDASRPFTEADQQAADMLRKAETPALLLLNKIDQFKDKGGLLALIERYRGLGQFDDYIPISARKGEGLDTLIAEIFKRLPEGPPYFPPDHVTDQPERFLAAELIREKVLRETRQEVPHSVAVTVDQWEEAENLTRIHASILVEREGQKGIVIGQQGAMLKRIGTAARHEMEAMFGRRVYLGLHVKVKPGWRAKPAFLDALDWRTMAGKDDG
jgi:GTPase